MLLSSSMIGFVIAGIITFIFFAIRASKKQEEAEGGCLVYFIICAILWLIFTGIISALRGA
jgi:hypothetical protein